MLQSSQSKRLVELPVAGLTIWQDTQSQCVSIASDILYKQALDRFADKPLEVLELGTGCGIVSIMCALYRPKWKITAIEIQPQLTLLATQNVIGTGVDVNVVTGDIRQCAGEYDLILSNPPWQKVGTGRLSPRDSRNLSRIELSCTMQDLLYAVKRNLKPEGRALIIYPNYRDSEMCELAPKTLLDIIDTHTHFESTPYITYIIKHQDRR